MRICHEIFYQLYSMILGSVWRWMICTHLHLSRTSDDQPPDFFCFPKREKRNPVICLTQGWQLIITEGRLVNQDSQNGFWWFPGAIFGGAVNWGYSILGKGSVLASRGPYILYNHPNQLRVLEASQLFQHVSNLWNNLKPLCDFSPYTATTCVVLAGWAGNLKPPINLWPWVTWCVHFCVVLMFTFLWVQSNYSIRQLSSTSRLYSDCENNLPKRKTYRLSWLKCSYWSTQYSRVVSHSYGKCPTHIYIHIYVCIYVYTRVYIYIRI